VGKAPLKYRAVIFDLFGTLVKNSTVRQHEDILGRMASILSAPPEDFIRLWYDTFYERCMGVLKTPEDNIDYVCRKLGVAIEDKQRNLAAHTRFELTSHSMVPLPDSVKVLSQLKSEGYKTGLLTDCSAEVPAIFPETPLAPLFDVTVFSCLVGMKKPDPRIYHLATEQLKVKPRSCLYIGDGSSQELTGAAAAGMHPVLIRYPDEDSIEIHRVDAEADRWNGPTISSLTEVLALLN